MAYITDFLYQFYQSHMTYGSLFKIISTMKIKPLTILCQTNVIIQLNQCPHQFKLISANDAIPIKVH